MFHTVSVCIVQLRRRKDISMRSVLLNCCNFPISPERPQLSHSNKKPEAVDDCSAAWYIRSQNNSMHFNRASVIFLLTSEYVHIYSNLAFLFPISFNLPLLISFTRWIQHNALYCLRSSGYVRMLKYAQTSCSVFRFWEIWIINIPDTYSTWILSDKMFILIFFERLILLTINNNSCLNSFG